jgi:uncharacterized protein
MRRLRVVLLSITALLAALLLVLVAAWPVLVSRLTFRAHALPPEHRSPAAWRYAGEEVHFRSADGTALHGWFLPSTTPEPCGTVLFLHGNAGNVAWHVGFTPPLTRHGLDVFLFDYRGYGASEGNSSEAGLHADAAAAYAYLRESRQLPPDRLLLAGHSLGAAVAARLASETEAAGLVLAAPFTSLPAAMQARLPWFPVGVLPWRTGRFDALVSIRHIDMPSLMLLGRDDNLVPAADARALFHAAAEPKVWVDVAGGHNEVFSSEEFHRAFSSFVRNTLGCAAIRPAG